MKRILLTTTSYQDTPGEHHQLLEETGWEIIPARGPLPESQMLELVGGVDGMICGDDELTRQVMEKALPRLQAISKYGIGVDKIDIAAATELGLPVLYTPGVNHTTVAEHALMLMLALHKHLIEEANYTAQGQWKRVTGNEIMGKTIGIIGMGRIGKEVAIRTRACGLTVLGYDQYWDDAFATKHEIKRVNTLDEIFTLSDIITLHTSLNSETAGMIGATAVAKMKKGVYIVNTARGGLVENEAIVSGLQSGKIAGYATDVLDQEPPPENHPLLAAPNCIITPHIGSRTYESVIRQATKATRNLILVLNGEQPLAQVNDVPIKRG